MHHSIRPLISRLLLAGGLILPTLAPSLAQAHFQEMIPPDDSIRDPGLASLNLDLTFTHPMEQGPVMPMQPPVSAGVITPDGKQQDLLGKLQKNGAKGATSYTLPYRLQQPGDHIFFLQPGAYWEPAEGKMIIHYTKVIVDAYSGPENWQYSVGFPVEIRPLSRPYGLWTGNLFRGEVLKQGKPLPYAEIEVEWRNDGSVTPPTDAHVTQVIQADAQGVFCYAMPRAGWWGFAALIEADQTQKSPDGQSVPVELGGLIWVKTRDMQ